MKKSIIPGIVISIMLLFVSCDMDSIFSGNTTVRISVKPLVHVESLQNSASRALLSFNEQTITLKAEADGMTPITQTLAYDSAKGAFSGSVTIEKGKTVTFTVEAKDAKGTVYVKGTETKTLEKATEKVAITLVPVLSDANKKETGLVFSDSFEGAVNGEVKAVAFAPAMPFDVTYTYKALNVAVTVSNREGKTLVNENKEWSMKQGEEVILLYTKTGETPMLLVYPKLVTVTFDANGGTGSMENQLIVTNLKANLIKNTFTKEGWVFTGWNTAKDGKGTSYADAAEVILAADTTLYAQWKKSTVSVSFNANGGTGTMSAQSVVPNTATALTKNTFTKEGFEFLCWTTYAAPYDGSFFDADGNFVYDEKFFDAEGNPIIDESKFFLDEQEISVAADTPLYALWISVQDLSPVTVTFDANGGDGSMDYIGAAVGDTVTLPQNSFTKTGHTFAYWLAVGYEELGPIYNGTDFFVPGDVTLVAQWTPNAIPVETVTVTFNANGGTGTMTPQTLNANVPTTLGPNTFTKDGYVFAAWCDALDPVEAGYVEAGAIDYTSEHFILDQSSIVISSDITLYAQWLEVAPAIVTFNANGGTGSMSSLEVSVGDYITLPANSFSKDGYTFNGWVISEYPIGTISDEAYIPVASNMTLVAQWTPNAIPSETVTITFNANGGTGTMAPQVITPGVATALTANTFTKDGYVFAAWCDVLDPVQAGYVEAGAIDYTSEHFILDQSSIAISSDITLYAQWLEVAPAIVTFNANGGTGSMSSLEVSVGDYITLPANSFSKDGYTFNGWLISEYPIGTISDEAYIPVASNITLLAQWTPNTIPSETIAITFDANGGTGTMGPQLMEPGTATALTTNTFVRDGYLFLGWHDTNQNALDPVYTDGYIFSSYSDIKLYAIWAENLTGTLNMTIEIPSAATVVVNDGAALGSVPIDGTIEINISSSISLSSTSMLLNVQSIGSVDATQTITINLSEHYDKVQTGANTLTLVYEANGMSYSQVISFIIG